MTIGRTRAFIVAAGMLTISLTASSAPAALTDAQKKCEQAIAKSAQSFVKGKLKLLQRCRNANLEDGTSCPTPDPEAIAKLGTKFTEGIAKKCTFLNASGSDITPGTLASMGFPGPCTDANSADGFTRNDLETCLLTSHTTIVDQIFDLQYDGVTAPPAALAKEDLRCQIEVAKQSIGLATCILKHVQKCRNAVMQQRLFVPPDLCATDDPKTRDAIQKCRDKLATGIADKCTDAQIDSLNVCAPDTTDAATAATCLTNANAERIDGPEITVPPDLIDYEYATRGGVCGDNVINSLDEECDGTSDGACPGQCGTAAEPDGFFACLCKTKPRMMVIEHDTADSDTGWLGLYADGSVVEGGGHLMDLYDCDPFGNCNVGPSCSDPPHSPCSVPATGPGSASGTTADSICAALGQGTCRKERTANGPHCYQDINKKCAENDPHDAICNAPGDHCAISFHGPPVPAAAGGVAVCNVSVLSEDVVGTVNIIDGTSAVRIRQRAATHNPITQHKPCPVCGGYCAVSRERCAVDGDCGNGTGPCVTAAVCSDGTRKDKACRRTPPFGGEVAFFGVTSVDCPPDTGVLTTTNLGLDVDANPRTTGTVSMLPTFPCTAAGFTGNTCLGGPSEARPCTAASECPSGSCSPQCFCAGQSKPNACDAACVIPGGGGNDKAACVDDSECPGGFCHPADCRLDPLDVSSNQEGICSAGPIDGYCSFTSYRGCVNNAQCRPPACSFCHSDETCLFSKRPCFINSGIVRIGTPRTPNPSGDGATAGIYCVPSNGSAINAGAGFPGPGAVIQPETVIVVP